MKYDSESPYDVQKRSAQFESCLTKVIASLLSAVPESRWRSVQASALRMCQQELGNSQVSYKGSSVVFPVLAVPDDSTLQATINLVSGMGAVVLAAGQAKPTTTVGEMMDIAGSMMGQNSTAFVGDPSGIGMPVASAIAAAASADPEIVSDASRMGLATLIADISRGYDCVGHQGPLSMVHVPDANTRLLAGGIKDWVTGLFNSNDSVTDRLSDKAQRKTDKYSSKEEKLSDKISDIQAEIAQLKSELAVTTDAKRKKKLQKKIEKLEKKLARKENKKDRVSEKLSEWSDAADVLRKATPAQDEIDQDEGDEGRRRRGEDALASDLADKMNTAASELQNQGLSSSMAGILAGYLIPQGINRPVEYISKLATQLDLTFEQAARYAIYVASGITNSDAMSIVRGEAATPPDIEEFIQDARAKNDAYRIALQDQMKRLQYVNEAAATATRMMSRSEWADAIMSSSDEVADWLQKVSPDASNTTSMMSSILSLVAAAKYDGGPGSSLRRALDEGLAKGVIDANAAYMMTGDPTFIPALAILSPSVTPEIQADIHSEKANPVIASFMDTWG